MRFDLSDDEWSLLEPLMPKSRLSARVDDRKIMNALFYVLRTGIPWRDLPERYGPYTTAYNRFNRWSRRGIWKRIFDTLALKSRDSLYRIDSTIVKAHRAASGARGAKAGHRHQPRLQRHQEIRLSQELLSPTPPNRKLLLPHQGMAPHRHTIRTFPSGSRHDHGHILLPRNPQNRG
jgi:transposase